MKTLLDENREYIDANMKVLESAAYESPVASVITIKNILMDLLKENDELKRRLLEVERKLGANGIY